MQRDKWQIGNPDVLMYLAALTIGVPLTMWELWIAGKTPVVVGLACLWVATVVTILVDFSMDTVSRASNVFFFTWVAVVIGGGIYAHVV